ncbi:MAG: hypothetical protein M3071_16020 [Actinomycetota bacterium]|nr:hypothetical protein [Actinomycetota bacterium]
MCGLEIRHAGDEILSIRGNAENSSSRGHICPKGAALGDLHCDPDRIRFPLRRTAGGWRPSSCSATRRCSRPGHRPHRVLPVPRAPTRGSCSRC